MHRTEFMSDNIGLNGVLITESENERNVLLQAESWVEPTERLVFVEASVDGAPASRPILLRVTRADNTLAPTRPCRPINPLPPGAAQPLAALRTAGLGNSLLRNFG